jgi:dTDP-glucose pyrophosphorylase/CBS domain-containing protein
MKNIIIKEKISLIKALQLLKKSGKKCLIISNKNLKLLGTLTDGDIRNLIISGKKLNTSIDNFYNKNPKFVFKNQYNIKDLRKEFLKDRYELIPVVDKNKKIVDVISWDQAFKKDTIQKKKLKGNIKLVIMAGGQGIRLKPFTSILPKPLIPINDKSVLEHILENFYGAGIKNILISLNFKSKTIKAYCEELKPKYKIKFITETKPLGTIGSLSLLKKETGNNPLFVTNGDIIIKSDIQDIYNFHIQKKNDITLVVAAKKFKIPYGVCSTDKKGQLTKIIEKPFQEALINTGLYIMNPKVLNLIPSNKKYDLTHFLKDAKAKKKQIGVYPVSEDSWIDVGEWDEYKKSANKLKI